MIKQFSYHILTCTAVHHTFSPPIYLRKENTVPFLYLITQLKILVKKTQLKIKEKMGFILSKTEIGYF
jgi:hypothetical protein